MDAAILKTVRLALEVISDRLVTLFGLSMSFALGCWTMWGPEWERVATLQQIFVAFAYLTVRVKEKRNDTGKETSEAA
jgi:TRAP-type C4-dicarboxylate transport system permease small subunit